MRAHLCVRLSADTNGQLCVRSMSCTDGQTADGQTTASLERAEALLGMATTVLEQTFIILKTRCKTLIVQLEYQTESIVDPVA